MSAPSAIARGLLGAFALTLGTACSSSAGTSGNDETCSAQTTFPTSTLTSLAGSGGKLSVNLRSAPSQPLQAGLDCVELTVTDASSGAPVDGLSIEMTPWMPAMGHGASVTPQLTALGQGRYVFTNVSLFMPGEWELKTQFSGAVSDSVNPTFNVN